MPETRHRGETATEHAAHSTRVKDSHQEHKDMTHGLSDNTRGFYDELTELFPEIRVTSGKRGESPSGNFSHHHNGDALDIGAEHTNIYEYLNNTPEGLDLMHRYGFGILDETDPRNMQKTSATGAHFHIGKDSGLYEKTKERYNQVDNIKPVYAFGSKNPNFDYSDLSNLDGANLQLTGNYVDQEQVINIDPDMVGADDRLGSEFRVIVPNKQTAMNFKAEIKKESDKADIKSANLEGSNARKFLVQEEQEAQDKIEKVFKAMGAVRQRDQQTQERLTPEQNNSYIPPKQVDIQQGLPSLPNLFKS